MYEPTVAAMGFVPGRSIVDNAAVHTGRNYVFNTDLKDFFPSIHQARVWKTLQLKPFSFNKEVASVVAGLCCMLDPNGITDKKGMIIGVLPQGSPCSPILTNIICRNLDRKLLGLAKRFNLRYTRYADDITFSSDYNVFKESGEFMEEFTRIIAEQGFEINDNKTRLQKSGQRQEVTGLVVNQKANIAKEYYRDIRSLLYIWKRYGQNQAYAKFCVRYKASKAYKSKKNTTPNMATVISGKLLYMKMVMGEKSSTYLTLRDKFVALCPEQKKVLDTNLIYLVSYRLDEFESSFATKVEFGFKSEGKITGRSNTMGSFMLDGEKHLVSINIRCDNAVEKYLTAPEDKILESLKKRLYISLAERGDSRFWLITRARMSNEHGKSFEGEYKAKLREGAYDYQDLVTVSDIIENNESPEIDVCLSEFISSGFNFKILEQWDRTKKS
jgi:retron-type reverse transcriptase